GRGPFPVAPGAVAGPPPAAPPARGADRPRPAPARAAAPPGLGPAPPLPGGGRRGRALRLRAGAAGGAAGGARAEGTSDPPRCLPLSHRDSGGPTAGRASGGRRPGGPVLRPAAAL